MGGRGGKSGAGKSGSGKKVAYNGTRAQLRADIKKQEADVRFLEKIAKKQKNPANRKMYEDAAKTARKTLMDLYAADLNGSYKK